MYQISFILRQSQIDRVEPVYQDADALSSELIETGPDKNKWRFIALFKKKPLDESTLFQATRRILKNNNLTIIGAPVPRKNWLKETAHAFAPLTLGNYFIYGSHFKEPLPADKITLKIDAATAFGSGRHATTQACLQALDFLADHDVPVRRILDLGCGSGILAFAAAHCYPKAVIDAVDCDEESVRMARFNARENHITCQVWCSDAFQNITEQYDLIFANILARPLIQMADSLIEHLNPNGHAILSGFLTHQHAWVMKAYKPKCEEIHQFKIKEWQASLVKRN